MGLDRRLRENALMTLWPQVVGDALALKSRPLFVDIERNLVVAAASGSVAQELSLMKPQLMRHLTKLGASLNVEIKGLRLDLKHFHRGPVDGIVEPPPVPAAQPEPVDLAKVNLSSEDQAALQAMEAELSAPDSGVSNNEQMRRRILKLFEHQLRIRAWRRQQGYPICSTCGDPAPRLHPANTSPATLNDGTRSIPDDNRLVCPACLYSGYTLGSY